MKMSKEAKKLFEKLVDEELSKDLWVFKYEHETPKAILVEVISSKQSSQFWLPKSQIKFKRGGTYVAVQIPAWLQRTRIKELKTFSSKEIERKIGEREKVLEEITQGVAKMGKEAQRAVNRLSYDIEEDKKLLSQVL